MKFNELTYSTSPCVNLENKPSYTSIDASNTQQLVLSLFSSLKPVWWLKNPLDGNETNLLALFHVCFGLHLLIMVKRRGFLVLEKMFNINL